ncbi:MAG TPA: TolC family protein [Myxococcales bacterium]|nr:TolC family protein [Myxococcales bacterium]
MIRAFVLAVALSSATVAQQQAAPPAQQQASPQPQQQGPQPLTLDDAVKLSLERNPDLQRQILLTLSAEQDKVLARSSILPQVDFNASLARVRTNGPVLQGGVETGQTVTNETVAQWNYGGRFTVTQLIFDGGRWWNNMAAQDSAYQSNVAQTDEQRLQITYLVEQRFYELVRAQRTLQVLGDAAARSRDQADYTQRLFEGGRATQADVYAARANRDNDEVTRLGQERAVELARADLALAIGVDPAEPLTVVEPQRLMSDPAQPPAPKDAVSRALENRPAIKAASLLVESNQKLTSAAKGDYWPALSANAGWNRGTTDASQYFQDPLKNSQASIGLTLSWNLFRGLATDANVRKAELQAMISQNDLANARRNVASDVEKAVAQLSTAGAQARVAKQAEDTAKEGLRLARTRQEVGVGTQLEVRDAELKLTQAQLNVVGSLVDGREAESALRRAQGG